MIAICYPSVDAFLRKNQAVMEQDEAAHHLILGVCLHMMRFPETVRANPYQVSIEEAGTPVATAAMVQPNKLFVAGSKSHAGGAMTCLAQDLDARRRRVSRIFGPDPIARIFAESWSAQKDVPFTEGLHASLQEVTRVADLPSASGRLRLATEEDTELVADWCECFHREALPSERMENMRDTVQHRIAIGEFFIWEDQKPVSMVAKMRPTTTGIAIGWVYTPPEWRGRGYATAGVATLSQNLMNSGRQRCWLFTDVDNPVSNHIYRKIGYRPILRFEEYLFANDAEKKKS